MKIYLAGPMRGYPQFNFPAFFAAARRLREEGHVVFNPAEKDVKKHGSKLFKKSRGSIDNTAKKLKLTPLEFKRRVFFSDAEWICKHAEGIALLPGWKKSKGAKAEKAIADFLGIDVIFLSKEFIK